MRKLGLEGWGLGLQVSLGAQRCHAQWGQNPEILLRQLLASWQEQDLKALLRELTALEHGLSALERAVNDLLAEGDRMLQAFEALLR